MDNIKCSKCNGALPKFWTDTLEYEELLTGKKLLCFITVSTLDANQHRFTRLVAFEIVAVLAVNEVQVHWRRVRRSQGCVGGTVEVLTWKHAESFVPVSRLGEDGLAVDIDSVGDGH